MSKRVYFKPEITTEDVEMGVYGTYGSNEEPGEDVWALFWEWYNNYYK